MQSHVQCLMFEYSHFYDLEIARKYSNSKMENMSFISTSLPGKSIDPEHLYHQAASNIIASIIFGSRFNYQDEYFQILITSIKKLTKIVIGQWAMVNTMKSKDTVYLH